nr:TnsD family Tn7-like transposition protein [Cupriavidus sp. AcVe19-6a]
MRWFLEESNGCTAPARETPCYQPAQVTCSLRTAKRKEWLKARAEHPEASRTVLRGRKWRLYAWLRTNDRRWFEAHLPKRIVRRGKRGQEGYSKSMLGVLADSAASGSCARAGLPASRSDYQMRMGLGLQERKFAKAKQNASGASWMVTHPDSRQAFVRERIEWAVTRLHERNKLISIASIAHASKLRLRTVHDYLEKKEPK